MRHPSSRQPPRGGAHTPPGQPLLRTLLVEDSEADAELIVRELQRARYEVRWERVDTAAGLQSALDHTWDLIICDWRIPGFSGAAALQVLCEDRAQVAPVLVVSGDADPDLVRQALQAGADDVIGKHDLDRLPPVVARELADAAGRRERRWRHAVRHGTDRYVRALLENALELTAILGADGVVQFASAAIATVIGEPPDELQGRSAFDWIHPEDVPRLRRRLTRAQSTPNGGGRLYCRVRRAAGAWATLELTVRNLTADPVIGGLLVHGRDVTAERRSQQLLRQRAAEIADLYDHAPCGYHSLDRDGRIVAINATQLTWLGYRREEIVGCKRFGDLLTPASRELFAHHFPLLLATGEVKDLELEMVRRDGPAFPVLLSATAVRDAHGRVVRTRSTVVDLTDRKVVERANRSNEERFRRFMEAAPDAVLVVREDGHLIDFVNHRAEELFGYRSDELMGQSVELLVPEGLRARHAVLRDEYTRAPRARPMGSGLEIQARRKDGSEFLADIMLGPVDLGTARLFFAVVRDATAATLAERARRERTRLLDAVFDHSLSCLVLLDPAFNFVRVNAAYAEACRRPLRDFAGRNHFDVFPSDAREIFEEVLRTKQPYEVKARAFSFPDQPERGETYWDWTLVPLLDDRGAVELLLFSLHDVTEHVRTARAQQASEERFRTLIEQSLDLIAIVDRDGIYRYVNPAHEAVCGLRPDQLVGTSAFALLHPEDAGAAMEYLRRAMANRERGATLEVRVPSRDGGWRVIEGVTLNLIDDPGVGGVLVTGRDVTERRRAEAELRANSERLRLSLQLANVAAFNQDRDLRYTWIAYPQGDFSVEQVIGRTHAELLGNEADELRALKESVLRTASGVRKELEVVTDGRARYFDVALEPLRDATGAVIGLTGATHEITERKRVEATVRADALRLEIVQQAYGAMLGAGSVGDVVAAVLQRIRRLLPCELAMVLLTDVEAGLARVIGADAAEPARVRALTAYPLSDFPPLVVFTTNPEIYVSDLRLAPARSPAIQQLFEDGARTLLAEALVVERELLGMFLLCAPEPDAFAAEHRAIAREVAAQFAVALAQARLRERLQAHAGDLERRVRERTAELEQANRDLDSFTYSVSHDLRAPLRRVQGFSRALLEDYGDGLVPGARTYVDAIVQGSGRMTQLIDDLLRLARLAQQEIVRERVDLSAQALAIRSELHAADPRRQVEWTIAPGVVVDGDARLLHIVLQNLLGNAWKFTGHRALAHIELGVGDRDGTPVYFVRDDGAGFDMAYADRLFGVFQRLHSDTEFEGTGIGLATVQRIIHGHGGTIWAEAAIDRGATFSFTLTPECGA